MNPYSVSEVINGADTFLDFNFSPVLLSYDVTSTPLL